MSGISKTLSDSDIVQAAISKPYAREMTVTPDQAVEWLNRNTRNRRLQERAVADLARDMLADAWVLNGEAIKIAIDGTILDGQHRLQACILAGKPFKTFVVTGLPLTSQDTMDGGRKRTAADMFKINGEKEVNILASVVRRLWGWDRGDRRFASNPSPTKAEHSLFLKEHPEIRESVRVASSTYHSFPYLSASALGVVHFLTAAIDEDQAADFFDQISKGHDLPVNHPVYTLRRRALRDKEIRGMRASATLTLRAWNAVRDEEELSMLVYDSLKPARDPK